MEGDINLNIDKRFKNTYLLRHQRLNLKHVFSDQLVQYKVLTCKEACYRRIDVTGPRDQGTVMPRFLVTSAHSIPASRSPV